VTPEERLAQLGHQLEPPAPAVARYVGAVAIGELLFVSGHGPFQAGEFVFKGKLGRDLDVETGRQAARLVALNMLSTIKATIGELDRVTRVVKLLILVNSMPDFTQQHLVANGASELLIDVFGQERGPHARSAIGVPTLPFGIAVEIEGVFAVDVR
jgi:enamine deaminase RidA (YjgF/YER057c/UK114 family)